MAANNVGTIAVPRPSSAAPAGEAGESGRRRRHRDADALNHMPPAISHFRPSLSEKAPVKSWPIPTAG